VATVWFIVSSPDWPEQELREGKWVGTEKVTTTLGETFYLCSILDKTDNEVWSVAVERVFATYDEACEAAQFIAREAARRYNAPKGAKGVESVSPSTIGDTQCS